MASDVKQMIKNLLNFYDFKEKTVVSVGIGGGQMAEYGYQARKVIAVDHDQAALIDLEKWIRELGLTDKFTLLGSDFSRVKEKGDLVLFEFCLHEMEDVEEAVAHALTLAPDVMVFDHWPGSEWAYIVDEKEKVERCWKAMEKFGFKKVRRYDTVQFFHDFDELYRKVIIQGETTLERIKPYRGKKDFTIPMSYGMAWIK